MQVARLMAQQISKKKTLLSTGKTHRNRQGKYERVRGRRGNILGEHFCSCFYLCDLACNIRKALSVAGPVGSTYVRQAKGQCAAKTKRQRERERDKRDTYKELDSWGSARGRRGVYGTGGGLSSSKFTQSWLRCAERGWLAVNLCGCYEQFDNLTPHEAYEQ